MCYQVCLWLVAVVILSIFDYGHALKCWRCSSTLDITCKDPLDVHRIRQNVISANSQVDENAPQQPAINYPHVTECQYEKFNYNFKNTCLKKIIRGQKGKTIYVRECKMVPRNLTQGLCEEKDAIESNYCSTCETNMCNGSVETRSNSLISGVISTILVLLLLY